MMRMMMIKAINTVKELYPEADLAMRIGSLIMIITMMMVMMMMIKAIYTAKELYPEAGLAMRIDHLMMMVIIMCLY